MPTQNHNLDYLDVGSYVADLQSFADYTDEYVFQWGTLDDRPAPSEGRLFLDIDGEENDDADTILYGGRLDANGDPEWIILDLEIAQDLSNATHDDQEETLTYTWEFEQVFDGDVLGHCAYADTADHADAVGAADEIDGHTGGDLLLPDEMATINGQWEYDGSVKARGTVDCTGGVLGFPSYGEQ